MGSNSPDMTQRVPPMLHFTGIALYSTTLAHFWSIIKAGTGLGAGAVAANDAAQFKAGPINDHRDWS